MTKLLDKAREAVRRLPPDSQDEIARAMLTLSESDGEAEIIDAAHLPAVLEGLTQTKRRDFATDAEIEAILRHSMTQATSVNESTPVSIQTLEDAKSTDNA